MQTFSKIENFDSMIAVLVRKIDVNFFLYIKYPSLLGTCGATGNLKEAEKHSISYF